MAHQQISERTKKFALAILVLLDELPRNLSNGIISKQIGRSATSVAANYRAAQQSRSRKEFVARLGIVAEEADETHFWLTLLEHREPQNISIKILLKEANELTAIIISSVKTAKQNLEKISR